MIATSGQAFVMGGVAGAAVGALVGFFFKAQATGAAIGAAIGAPGGMVVNDIASEGARKLGGVGCPFEAARQLAERSERNP